MPELPEVETVRRGLLGAFVGARFLKVEQRRPDLRFPFPERFAERLEGRTVERLERRAKYLLARLTGGGVLVMHLGMTGRFSVISSPSPRNRRGQESMLGEFVHAAGGDAAHDHVVFTMSSGAVVTYNDARRFGCMDLITDGALEAHRLFRGLGVEPLGPAMTAEYMASAAHGRATDLKAFLMDQRIIAGLGNIYVCEALFRAELSPQRGAATLATRAGKPREGTNALVAMIRGVLEEAIAAGGSTLRDYAHTDGSLGYFQHTFQVYGREGGPCVRPDCGGTVRRIVQGGRSTFYCPACQR